MCCVTVGACVYACVCLCACMCVQMYVPVYSVCASTCVHCVHVPCTHLWRVNVHSRASPQVPSVFLSETGSLTDLGLTQAVRTGWSTKLRGGSGLHYPSSGITHATMAGFLLGFWESKLILNAILMDLTLQPSASLTSFSVLKSTWKA